jgi:hypothetical protein
MKCNDIVSQDYCYVKIIQSYVFRLEPSTGVQKTYDVCVK